MVDPKFDSVLARKLSMFLRLSPEEFGHNG